MTVQTATAHAFVIVNGLGIHVDVTAATAADAVAQITGIPGVRGAEYDDNGRLVTTEGNAPATPAVAQPAPTPPVPAETKPGTGTPSPVGNGSQAPGAPAATTSAPPAPSAPVTAPPTAATPSATQTAAPSNPGSATVEPEALQNAAIGLLDKGGEAQLVQFLQQVGAQTVGTCPAEKRAELLALIQGA